MQATGAEGRCSLLEVAPGLDAAVSCHPPSPALPPTTPCRASCFPAGLLACGKSSAGPEKSPSAVSHHGSPSESVSQAVAATSDGAFAVPHFSKLQEGKDDTEAAVQSQELT